MTDKTKTAKPSHGFDGAGHMDAGHAQRLRELGKAGQESDPRAFLDGTSSDDELAEELAEAAVTSMTSGEDTLTDELNAEVEEDAGGPFVSTSGRTEFAGGTDESNTADATREPFPTT